MKTSRTTLITLLVGVIVSIIFAVIAQATFLVKSINYGLLRVDISQCEIQGKKSNWSPSSTEAYNKAVSNMDEFVKTNITGRLHNFLARFGWAGNLISVILTFLAGLGLYSIISIVIDEIQERQEIKRRRRSRNYSRVR